MTWYNTDCAYGTVTYFSRILFRHKPTEQLPAHAKQTLTFTLCPGKFSLQITITCKYYKKENIQTHSKLVNQLMQRTDAKNDIIEWTLSIGKKCQKNSAGWGKPFLHSHVPEDLAPGISEFSLVCNKDLETPSDTQPQVLNHYLCSLLPATTLSRLVQTRAAALKNYAHLLL